MKTDYIKGRTISFLKLDDDLDAEQEKQILKGVRDGEVVTFAETDFLDAEDIVVAGTIQKDIVRDGNIIQYHIRYGDPFKERRGYPYSVGVVTCEVLDR